MRLQKATGHGAMLGKTKVRVQLTGVPETLLWPLYNRACEARRGDAMLRDPKAIELTDSLDYPFEKHFGGPEQFHVLRARGFDRELRQYLQTCPDATVVALGEGLETQFWRVDNGRVRWLAVDLPETIELRQRLLPDSERHRNMACSALDLRWMDEVDPSHGVLITAAGLLMYFEAGEVERLITSCANRFSGGYLMFDTIPRWLSQKTRKGLRKMEDYQTPVMPWWLDVDAIPRLRSVHPNIVEAREVDLGPGRGFLLGVMYPRLQSLPVLRNHRPALALLRFGTVQ
jgi:O-methyltransferase involved in polyketide biosynthesis